MTAAVCGGNYAERLRLPLIAERSSFTPTGAFGETRWREKKTKIKSGERE